MQSWQEADATQRRELQALVQARVDEQRLANELAASAPPADPEVAAKDKQAQILQALQEAVNQEKAERERLQDALQEEQAERERLQAELDAAKAAAAKAGKAKKKKKDEDDSGDASDWKKCTSKSGKPFWYNKKTKKSVWKDPT